MNQELHQIQTIAGAIFAENNLVPVSFCQDEMAIEATKIGVALCDRSHWGRIQVSDRDRIRFLHNQSTNDFNILQPGQGCDTVFVTSTARVIDLATAYITENDVILLVSPNRREKLMQWLDRYIFFADQVKLVDLTEKTITFSLIGPKSNAILEQLGAIAITTQPQSNHQIFLLDHQPVRVAVGSGLVTPGYTLIADANHAVSLWKTLTEAGAIPLGDRVWEQLRIAQGRPVPDQELTEDYNPLEAGLWQTISFNKGCYIGQETIARLNTYKGVKTQLWGIHLEAPVTPGTVVTIDEEKVGKLTSCTETAQGYYGLGYIRTKVGGAGLKVKVGEIMGEVVDVPFLTHVP